MKEKKPILRPCHRCKNSAHFVRSEYGSRIRYHIECNTLNCNSTRKYFIKRDAANRWNTRPIEDKLIATLEEAISYLHLSGSYYKEPISRFKEVIKEARGEK